MSSRRDGSDGDGGSHSNAWSLPDDYVQPVDPPKVIVHNRQQLATYPDAYRHVFGTNPPKGSIPPVPPPPLPPNSYHKKPKYWQTRGTTHMAPNNRMSVTVCGVVAIGVYFLDRLSDLPERWSTRLGYHSTAEEAEQRERNNMMYCDLMTSGIPIEHALEASPDKAHYRNPRRKDKEIRWDVREIDERILGIKDMRNPFEI